jgi:ABC-type phosphate/phosphonate transport system substrate-binding protein
MTRDERAAARKRCEGKSLRAIAYSAYREGAGLAAAAKLMKTTQARARQIFDRFKQEGSPSLTTDLFRHARTDLPAALDELDRLEALLRSRGIDPDK